MCASAMVLNRIMQKLFRLLLACYFSFSFHGNEMDTIKDDGALRPSFLGIKTPQNKLNYGSDAKRN